MSRILITGSGSGGASSDELTAQKNQVLEGYTAITQDSDDEPAEGTMPERGNWNGSVGMNGSIIIPEGHHDGSGKVTGPAVTQRGAWTSRLGINGKVAIPEGYHNGTGYVDQAIATQGAMTLNPGTTAKTGAVNGKYMTGNITVPAVSIPANLIKKGAQITFPDGSKSPVGTWEGYVAPTRKYILQGRDFYDSPSFNGTFSYENDYILVNGYAVYKSSIAFDLIRYKKLFMFVGYTDTGGSVDVSLIDVSTNRNYSYGLVNFGLSIGQTKLVEIPLSPFSGDMRINLGISHVVVSQIYLE